MNKLRADALSALIDLADEAAYSGNSKECEERIRTYVDTIRAALAAPDPVTLSEDELLKPLTELMKLDLTDIHTKLVERMDYWMCKAVNNRAITETVKIESAKRLTVGEQAARVGAWETSEGNVTFGSWQAVAAFYKHAQFAVAVAESEPVAPSATQDEAEQATTLLNQVFATETRSDALALVLAYRSMVIAEATNAVYEAAAVSVERGPFSGTRENDAALIRAMKSKGEPK